MKKYAPSIIQLLLALLFFVGYLPLRQLFEGNYYYENSRGMMVFYWVAPAIFALIVNLERLVSAIGAKRKRVDAFSFLAFLAVGLYLALSIYFQRPKVMAMIFDINENTYRTLLLFFLWNSFLNIVRKR